MNASWGSDTGIQAVGEVRFGSHFCQFYRTKEDLVDTLLPYFMAGLRNGELCMWVTSDPLPAEEAAARLRDAMPEFPELLAKGQIEIWNHQDWYLENGRSAPGVLQGWIDREKRALDEGYAGLRLTGNTFWLERDAWDEFVAYESAVNQAFGQYRIIALCSYCLDHCRAEDVIDVCRNHQFALTRRHGDWEIRVAHDGEEALAAAAAFRPDVALLDIGLPKLDGYELARRLRLDPENAGLLLVAITGYGRDEDRDQGKLAGFDQYLVKPVDPNALRGLLAKARRPPTPA